MNYLGPIEETPKEGPEQGGMKYLGPLEAEKPSYWEAAKTGFREGISGALRFYEAPFKPIARAMGIPPGLEASEWIKPSEEEARRAEEMDIPHQVARGFGGLPGAALKYGPTGRVLGPVTAFMAPEVIEGISEGRPLPEMARRTAMAGGVGLGFKYLPKSMLARVPALAGLFGGQTTAEALIEGRPLGEALKAGIAPSVVGGAIGLLPGGRREIPRREPPPERPSVKARPPFEVPPSPQYRPPGGGPSEVEWPYQGEGFMGRLAEPTAAPRGSSYEFRYGPEGEPIGMEEPRYEARPRPEVTPPMEAEKQPWEMTKAEWEEKQAREAQQLDSGLLSAKESRLRGIPETEIIGKRSHRMLVRDAVREGKPVPPEVLKDYPDLQVPPPRTPEQVVDQLIADKKALPFEREKLIRQITEPRVEPPPAEGEFEQLEPINLTKPEEISTPPWLPKLKEANVPYNMPFSEWVEGQMETLGSLWNAYASGKKPLANLVKRQLFPTSSGGFYSDPRDYYRNFKAYPKEMRNLHRESVKQALSEGKPISPEVLKDYSDLAEEKPKFATQRKYEVPKDLKPLAEEIESVGATINPDGTIDLYHATTKEKAQEIIKSGYLKRPSDAPDSYGVYASTSKTVAEDYGDGTLIKIRVPLSEIHPDDVFPGKRLDFSIPTKNGIYKPIKIGTEDIKFATGERPTTPLSPEDLQRVSDTHSLENSPEKRIVETYKEFPERMLREIPKEQWPNIKAAYDPVEGLTYLVRENLGSVGEAIEAIKHEDIKHHALDKWLEKKGDMIPWFNRVYLKYGRSGLQDIATERGLDLNTGEGRIEAAREKIARTPIDEPGVIKQFWAWLMDKVSKIFPKTKITEAEIQNTFKQAREAMERGEFRERDERIDSLRKQVRNIQAVYTERAQFATSPKEVGKKFAEEDLVPKAARFGKGLKESYEWIADGLVPVRGVPAKAMQTVKHYMGKLMEEKETLAVKEIIGDLTGRKIGNTFDKMSEKQNEDFINLGMVGEKQASSLLDQIREFMGNIDQHDWEEAKSYKPDLGWVDNHLRLLLKPGSSGAQVKLFRDTLSRKFPGTMGWSKQRFYETLQAAQEAGLELAVKNPWEMWKLGHLDVQQFIQFNKMKSALQNEGFLKQFKPEGPGKAFKGLEGYAKTTENMNNIWFPGKGEGWYIEENLGRILNNYLSPDRIRANALGRTMMSIKNHTTVMELAVNAFHATTETTTAVFSALGEAGRKIYNVGILQGNQRAIEQGLKDLAKAPFAPLDARLGGSLMKYFANPEEFKKTFRGSEFLKKIPNPDEWLQLLWDSGARFGMSEDYRLNTLKTFKQNLASKNYIGAIFRSVPSLNEIMMKPLFENYIPKLKVGTWLKETANMIAEKSDDIISGKITKEQIGAERWNSVEERFGEMSFDNQFWNRTFKTGMQMFVRSLTWQTGNIKQFGKGITGQSAELIAAMREGRMPKLTPEGAWMMATFAGTAAIGYITQKALSGKDVESWKDFFYPQIDEEGNRISIPGYAKVGFAMAHHPLRYAGGALAGWFGRFTDVINNKEFYGAQIHDPEENIISQRIDDLIHLVPLPFSYTSFKKAREEGEPFLKQFTGVLGATQAPYWIRTSEAQQLATELAGAKIPAGGMTKADRARTDLIKKYAREYQQAQRKGESVDEIFSKVQGDLQSGKLIQRDLLRFKQRITHEPLEQSVLRLSLKEALRVWEKATPEEQMKIAPYVLRKFRTTQSPEEREMAMPKIQEIAGGMR